MWFKADDGLMQFPEVLAIPTRYRAPAMGVWLLCGSWLAAHPNDDRFVPDAIVAQAGGAKLRRYLVENDFWLDALGGVVFTALGCRIYTLAEVKKHNDATAARVRNHRKNRSAAAQPTVRESAREDEQGKSRGRAGEEQGKPRNRAGENGQAPDQPLPDNVTPLLTPLVTPSVLGVGVGMGISNTHTLTSKDQLLPKSGTSLARRPKNAIVVIIDDEEIAVGQEARDLVQHNVPNEMIRPRRTRDGLFGHTQILLSDGANLEWVKACLQEWSRRRDNMPGHLPRLYTELARRNSGPTVGRNGHEPSSTEERMAMLESLRKPPREKVITVEPDP